MLSDICGVLADIVVVVPGIRHNTVAPTTGIESSSTPFARTEM